MPILLPNRQTTRLEYPSHLLVLIMMPKVHELLYSFENLLAKNKKVVQHASIN